MNKKHVAVFVGTMLVFFVILLGIGLLQKETPTEPPTASVIFTDGEKERSLSLLTGGFNWYPDEEDNADTLLFFTVNMIGLQDKQLPEHVGSTQLYFGNGHTKAPDKVEVFWFSKDCLGQQTSLQQGQLVQSQKDLRIYGIDSIQKGGIYVIYAWWGEHYTEYAFWSA